MEDKKEKAKEPIKDIKEELSKPKGILVDEAKLNEMFAELKETKSKLERLEFAADKNRLGSYDERNKNKIIPECRLRVIDGKLVVGWRMTEDTVEEQANGQFYVKQTVEISYDGEEKKEEMPLRVFEKKYKLIKGKMVSESKDAETGNEFVDVKLEDGRKVKLNKIFLN